MNQNFSLIKFSWICIEFDLQFDILHEIKSQKI